MSDPNNPNIKSRTTPQWSLYRREAFWNTNNGEYPLFNTGINPTSHWELFKLRNNSSSLTLIDPAEVEKLAKEKLSLAGWYVCPMEGEKPKR